MIQWKLPNRKKIAQKMMAAASDWLLKNDPPKRAYLCDFAQVCQKLLPGDVLLIEGRSRVSRVIKLITQSPWSHAMLYIGRLTEIENPQLQSLIQEKFSVTADTQILIESELGQGTIASPLEKYAEDHIRILRPKGLSAEDSQKVVSYAIQRIGSQYSIRHILDLGQFLLPWHLFPQKWRTRLFERSLASQPMEDICSSVIAQAFESIQFPILPLMTQNEKKEIELTERNSRLFTPSDFDFSPYFSVIKYPMFPANKDAYYRDLPWKDKMC